MPKFRIELNDGSKFEIEADTQPTQDEVVQFIKQSVPKRKGIGEVPLPGEERTEQLIAGRKPALETFREELRTPAKGVIPTLLKPVVTAFKGLGVVRERAESALSAPLLKAQELADPKTGFATGEVAGKFPGVESTPLTASEFKERVKMGAAKSQADVGKRFQFLKEAGQDIIKGLKGERITEFGDVPRRAGFPEPISAAIGLGTSLAIVDPLVNKAITRNISRVGKGIKNIATGEKTKVLRGVEEFVGGVDDFIGEAGDNVGKVFAGRIGQKAVDPNKIKLALDKLPQTILRKMKAKDAQKVFKIKFNERGQIINTKENIWRLRRFIDDQISPLQFQQRAKGSIKAGIKQSRNILRDELKRGDENTIGAVMDEYSKFIDDWGFVKSTLTEKGRPVANKVVKLFARGGEPAKKEAIQRLTNLIPRGKSVINRAVEFNKAETAVKAAGFGIGAEVLRRGFTRPVAEVVVGGGGGEAIPTSAR
ncbi:MAG TPA: hypothetical protein ENI23_12285 [bacterium]|nr:hypothetical protein [bacterium]